MSKSLGQAIIVENRTGAGGSTGADAVAKAEPDGYTLLMSSAGILTANQFLYAKMPFDPETAFVPISMVADMLMLVVVNPKVEAKTLGELVAFAKANPDKLNFGSPGVGTTGHLGLALFMHAAGIRITHVPYRGAAPALNDLLDCPDKAKSAKPTAAIVGPAISGTRAPTRSSRPPDQRDKAPMMIVKGKNTAPASVAEYPCT
jgi:tripartite-type tricarboxylate transporter receptor subunit TctC